MAQRTPVAKKPTLKTIAQKTGLTVPTVSRALNDAPDISAKTKLRVQNTAKRLGYVPNRAGVFLRTGRTHLIALVLPADAHFAGQSASLTAAIANAIYETQYSLSVHYYSEKEDPLTLINRIVTERSADAIILSDVTSTDPRVDYLRKAKFPFACFGRTHRSEDYPYFDFDHGKLAKLAVSQMAKSGRKNVGIILPPRQYESAHDALHGAMEAAKEAKIELIDLVDINCDDPTHLINLYIRRNRETFNEMDGLICFSTPSALTVINALEMGGKFLGRDFDIVSRETLPVLKLFRPGLHIVDEEPGQGGGFLLNAIIARLNEPESKPMQRVQSPKTKDLR